MFHKILLESDHNASRLFGLGTSANAQIDIGLGDIELLKEGLAHVFVVVLPSVDQPITDALAFLLSLLYGVNQRRNLHEIGPCPCYDGNFHGINDQ